jgi:hypothetical protein
MWKRGAQLLNVVGRLAVGAAVRCSTHSWHQLGSASAAYTGY